jgi:hypothetical protein
VIAAGFKVNKEFFLPLTENSGRIIKNPENK